MASGLRSAFITAAPGLERCLERELRMLKVPGQLDAVPGGVAIRGNEDSMWRVALQSRVAESARLHVGDPFHAPDVKVLSQRLQALPWEQFLPLAGPTAFEMPIFKVSSDKSRLYHTRMLEECAAEAIEARRVELKGNSAVQDAGGTRFDRDSTTSRSRLSALPPTVHMQLKHDECRVSIGAAGGLHMRGYRKATGETPLKETLAAACVLNSPLLRRLTMAAHSDEELVVWDPFCGSGGMLLEALGIAMGQPPGSPQRSHPFTLFPSHDAQGFAQTVAAVEPVPHPALSRLTLLGSDVSTRQLDHAQSNLRRLSKRLWDAQVAGEASKDELPCTVSFVEGSPVEIARSLKGRPTLLLTNAPYGFRSPTRPGEAGREALEAYSMLGRALRRGGVDWRGVYCLVAGVDAFRDSTGLEWSSEARFLNGKHWVDLLELSWSRQKGGGAGSARGEGRRKRNTPRSGKY